MSTPQAFIEALPKVRTNEERTALLQAALDKENEFRGLFARQRDSWEVPELGDAHVGLVDVYETPEAFAYLPKFADDAAPRCFDLGEKRQTEGLSIVPSLADFNVSWDCMTEGLLRFLDWSNLFAAGGAVAGCLARLPEEIASAGMATSRTKRRKHFHDVAFPASDVDLFLHGLTAEQAEQKLRHICEAVSAANPHEVLVFRSAHALTLVSQYPFRHVQIVLRLYNSPAEVLMGFDVDACACGYDGSRVYVCPRTAMAFAYQANVVDLTRRSPSYELRLAKYAERGFEVVVPKLVRERVDPFLFEKRYEATQGLGRLLLLERLRTPEARFQYRQEGRLKNATPQKAREICREMDT